MANKTLLGKVVSVKMKDSAVVEVTRKTSHPKYRKLITLTKKFTVDSKGMELALGEEVSIVETRKMAGNKHFKIERKIK